MRGNRNYMTSVQDGISIKQGFKQTFKKDNMYREEMEFVSAEMMLKLIYEVQSRSSRTLPVNTSKLDRNK